jgi:hypothetical protein
MESTPGLGEETTQQPKIEKVTTADLRPVLPKIDGTTFILQRNAKDNRVPGTPDIGALVPENAQSSQDQAREYFQEIFKHLGPEEKAQIDILIVAADTHLITPTLRSEHQRAVETAAQVMIGLKKAMIENQIPETQLLNKTGEPIQLSSRRLIDLRMMDESPDFVKWLKERSTVDGVFNEKSFWIAYEDDENEVRQKRLEMKVEGPEDIAERVDGYVATLNNAMKFYHESHPGRRVIVWGISHYDAISPWLKLKVADMSKTDYLPADQGAGIVVEMKKGEPATTQIGGNNYTIPFAA